MPGPQLPFAPLLLRCDLSAVILALQSHSMILPWTIYYLCFFFCGCHHVTKGEGEADDGSQN